MRPSVGDFWWVRKHGDPEKERWLVQIVATSVASRKRYFLGIKCDQDTCKPMPQNWHCHWFDSKGDDTDDGQIGHDFYLYEKVSV